MVRQAHHALFAPVVAQTPQRVATPSPSHGPHCPTRQAHKTQQWSAMALSPTIQCCAPIALESRTSQKPPKPHANTVPMKTTPSDEKLPLWRHTKHIFDFVETMSEWMQNIEVLV